MDGYGVSKMKRKYMMNKMMLIATLLVGVSSPVFAVVNPVNWLETDQAKAEEQKAPEQGDNPFKEDALFNLNGTRLTILIPKGFIWKKGESAKCCEEDLARASFDFWIEKNDENDDVRTQYGLQKVEKDSKRKATLMKSWEKRVRENMATIDKAGNFQSTALETNIITVGDGVRSLAASWFIMNKNGVAFQITLFEIWEGGQRDLIQFISMVEGNDAEKDQNHQLVLKMAQSLRMSRTEANPVW
jgi:hypothetical protein